MTHPSVRRGGVRRLRPGDAGFGLVESAVALLLLAIVVVPITHVVITTLNASNTLHLRAEAADLATQALETAQYQTANGVAPTSGVTSSTQYSGHDAFQVAVEYRLTSQSGTSATICTAPPGQTSSQIWSVTATVSWGTAGQKGTVVETTLISPASADLANVNAGEIAVPIYNADDQTLETATPINVSVACTGTGCGSAPSGQSTSGSANTGTTGCAVFPDLYAGSNVTYTVTVANNPGFVDPNELSDATTASGVPTRTNVAVQPDSVSVVTNPNIIYAPGAAVTVGFQTYTFTGATSSIAPAAYLPITVQSATLLCSSLAAETCVLGNGTAAGGFKSTNSPPALLFPGPSQIGTAPNYTAWAGDQLDSNPAFQVNGTSAYGTALPKSFVATSGATPSLTLPVYPLTLSLTLKSDAGTITTLTATDAGGGDTVTLTAPTGTSPSQSSSTGVPLGQFELAATTTGSSATLTSGSSSPVYVWVTPTGVCESPVSLTSPCATPSTSPIAVTVG